MVKATTVEATPARNAILDAELRAIQQIEDNAKAEKHKHLAKLEEVAAKLQDRIDELVAQKEAIEAAIAKITGRVVPAKGAEPRKRMSQAETDDLRKRLASWLIAHQGEPYTGMQLKAHFPEIGARTPSVLLAKEIEAGTIKKEGRLRGQTLTAV